MTETTEAASWIDADLSDLIASIQSGQRPYGGVSEDGGEIPSLGGENIRQGGGLELASVKKLPFSFFRLMTKGVLVNEDVLINKDGANTGKIGIYEGQFPAAVINEHLFLLRGQFDRLDQRFLYRLLSSEYARKIISSKISGSAQPGLKSDFIRHFPVRVPESTAEQSLIATVLDAVDEAIAKTEATIAKVKRVRAGLLHDLLTRGLNENGQVRDPVTHPEQFQDSLLGLVPVKWSIEKLDDLVRIIDCKHYTPKFVKEGKSFIRPRNVKPEGLDFSDVDYVSDEDFALLTDKHIPSLGDIVFSRNATFGIACYVDQTIPFAIGQDTIVMTEKAINTHFAYFALRSSLVESQIIRLSTGSTFGRINLAFIRSLLLPRPEPKEQQAIVERLVAFDHHLKIEDAELAKLIQLKSGLSNDLLAGRVHVPEEIDVMEHSE